MGDFPASYVIVYQRVCTMLLHQKWHPLAATPPIGFNRLPAKWRARTVTTRVDVVPDVYETERNDKWKVTPILRRLKGSVQVRGVQKIQNKNGGYGMVWYGYIWLHGYMVTCENPELPHKNRVFPSKAMQATWHVEAWGMDWGYPTWLGRKWWGRWWLAYWISMICKKGKFQWFSLVMVSNSTRHPEFRWFSESLAFVNMSLPGPTRSYAVLRRPIEWLEAKNWWFEVAEHFGQK